MLLIFNNLRFNSPGTQAGFQHGTRARSALAEPGINPLVAGSLRGLAESRGRIGVAGVVVVEGLNIY